MKQQGRAPRRKRGTRSFNRIEGIPSAPVSSVAIVRSGMKVGFTGSGESLRMSLHFRAAQVVVNSDASGMQFMLPSGLVAYDYSFVPIDSFYMPPYVYQLVRLFQRYKLYRARFTYEPRVNTSDYTTFVLASPNDISWLPSHGQTTAGIATPSENALCSLSNACTVVGYGRCVIDMVGLQGSAKNGTLYTAGPNIINQIVYTGANDALLRQTVGGQLLIAGNAGNAGAGQLIGDLYVDIELGLMDYDLAITNVIDLSGAKGSGEEVKSTVVDFDREKDLEENRKRRLEEERPVSRSTTTSYDMPKSSSRK